MLPMRQVKTHKTNKIKLLGLSTRINKRADRDDPPFFCFTQCNRKLALPYFIFSNLLSQALPCRRTKNMMPRKVSSIAMAIHTPTKP